MADAVQDDLRHGLLPGFRLAARLVIDRLAQAFEIARLVEGAAQMERFGGGGRELRLDQRRLHHHSPFGRAGGSSGRLDLSDGDGLGGDGPVAANRATRFQAIDQRRHLAVFNVVGGDGQRVVRLGDGQHRVILTRCGRGQSGVGEAAGRRARQPLNLSVHDRGSRQAAGKVSARQSPDPL